MPKKIFRMSFRPYACEGDTITGEARKLDVTARIARDDSSDAPDERQDGFWPSLDKNDAGYIGPKSKATLARHKAQAQAVMDAWKRDEWFYCGIIVSVSYDGSELGEASLWGIECNYPHARKRSNPNAYLTQVANEIAEEAITQALAKLASMAKAKLLPENA